MIREILTKLGRPFGLRAPLVGQPVAIAPADIPAAPTLAGSTTKGAHPFMSIGLHELHRCHADFPMHPAFHDRFMAKVSELRAYSFLGPQSNEVGQ